MPTLADIAAATPQCPQLVDRRELRQCDRPCTYDLERELWVCKVHGDVLTALELVAVVRFEEEMHAA